MFTCVRCDILRKLCSVDQPVFICLSKAVDDDVAAFLDTVDPDTAKV